MLCYNGAATPVLSDIQYLHADHAGTIVATSGGLVQGMGLQGLGSE